MFIKLVRDEEYRGHKYKKGDVIEVGGALGEKLILNGHKKTNAEAMNDSAKVLNDEEVDALEYKEVEKLIKEFEVEIENRKSETLKAALKSYFAGKRGN